VHAVMVKFADSIIVSLEPATASYQIRYRASFNCRKVLVEERELYLNLVPICNRS